MGTHSREKTRLEQPGGVAAPPGSVRAGVDIYGRTKRPRSWYLIRGIMVIAVLSSLIIGTRVIAAYVGGGDMLAIHIENQQPAIIDLRSSTPRSPYAFGVNVFPEQGTQALDGASGFMSYDSHTLNGLREMGITMLRFPGGTWGEEHTASYEQIDAYLQLARQIHATPLIQVRLSGGTPEQAAALVSYCNNPTDRNRENNPGAPFLPVHYWVIGNEPDLTSSGYTVTDYVRDFIAYATAMKAVDPHIQIFGPEISQYSGPNAPADASGTPWLTGFLQGIATYQRAHNTRILDGVSFHHYPFGDSTSGSTSILFASVSEWHYMIPLLGAEIHQIMGVDLPFAITEINDSAFGSSLASPLATALWWADTLGTLLEEHVSYVDFFSARGLAQPDQLLRSNGDATPLYRVMQLYTRMAANVIQVGATGGPISVYAATDTTRAVLTLMIINKSSNRAAVKVEPWEAFSHWSSAYLKVPPYAVLCVVMHRGGGGQTFLYGPTPQLLASNQTGTITTAVLP